MQTEDQIDELWFDKKTGFCAHYASAMTFMLRSQNIPARVVAGYMGGQWNDSGEYLNVRQMEAHAWVEYWQEGVGWMRADPTAAISPQRILGDITDAIEGAESLISSGLVSSLSRGIFAQMHWLMDDWQYKWRKWVVNFDNDEQKSIYAEYLNGFSWQKVGLIIGGSISGVFALFLIWFRYQQRLRFDDPVKKHWYLLQSKWRKKGYVFDEKASINHQLALISKQSGHAKGCQELLGLLNCYFYGKNNSKVKQKQVVNAMKMAVRWR